MCFFTLTAAVGAGVWTALARRREYERFAYWLLVALRYFVALTAFSYGIIKLFGQQMPFPSTSELATPLGDLLPMRLSWFFVGYSRPYQFFSGLMEVVAGALLLGRRTATLGAVVATGVFLNVFLLNLCYDIPVKLFSGHLFVFSALLLLADARRLLNFFVFNRPTQPRWEPRFADRRMRRARIGAKALFLVYFGAGPVWYAYQYAQPSSKPLAPMLPPGFYEVTDFRGAGPDSLRWQNVVFEPDQPAGRARGSIGSPDTLFRQRYRRAYFTYTLDSARQTIVFTKADTVPILTMRVQHSAPNELVLRGWLRGDSLRVALRRTPRHFQLAERQFHWLSEANR